MGRRGLPILIGLAWLAATGAAQAAGDVVELAPTTPWNVHYADDYCRLARIFGDDKQKIIFSIEQDAPGDGFRMTLTGQMMDGPARQGKASIRFGVMPEQKIMFFPGTVGEGQPAWIFGDSVRLKPFSAEEIASEEDYGIRSEPITEAEEAAVTSVTIGWPLRDPVRLKTGPMKAAFAAGLLPAGQFRRSRLQARIRANGVGSTEIT